MKPILLDSLQHWSHCSIIISKCQRQNNNIKYTVSLAYVAILCVILGFTWILEFNKMASKIQFLFGLIAAFCVISH